MLTTLMFMFRQLHLPRAPAQGSRQAQPRRWLNRGGGSAARTPVVRIKQWLAPDRGRAPLAQNVDLHFRTRRREIGSHVGQRDAAIERVAPGARGRDADRFATGIERTAARGR